MPKPTNKIIYVIITSCTLLLLSSITFKEAATQAENLSSQAKKPLQQIVLSANPTVTKHLLTRREIRAIFTMRLTHWPDGQPITVFVINDDNAVHIQFCKNVLNIFPHQLRAAWNKLEFSGTGQGPIELSTLQEMHKALTSTPGSIGYLKENTNDASLQSLQFR